MLAVIIGIKPNDQLEAMLAAQMAAIHIAMMTFTQRLGTVDNIPQQDSAERALNKLARTFTTQMETLRRYRTGGQQNVTVHHVSVSEGGQAIVGNVTRAANDTALEKPANATPALADERQPAMESIGKPEHSPVLLRRGQKDDGQSSA
jgi:SLT domain-containing protein